ncbi:MAG: aminodeoxychorismate lyase [Halioglobus sp.]
MNGERATSLPLPDRGLDFGDGLFETLLIDRGQALFSDLHFARLARGLAVLGFPDCLDDARAQLARAETHAAGQGWPWAALRLTVTRGSAPRGYAPPDNCQPRIVVTLSPLERDCSTLLSPARLVACSTHVSIQAQLAGLKHLNRLEQVLAATEVRQQGADEGLMCNANGQVIAVTAGNLFIVSGGQLLTPPLQHSGIAGTRRQKILDDWAPAIGLAVNEQPLRPADIEQAQEVFYSNSLVGLRPVAQFSNTRWTNHATCESLFAVYRSEAG